MNIAPLFKKIQSMSGNSSPANVAEPFGAIAEELKMFLEEQNSPFVLTLYAPAKESAFSITGEAYFDKKVTPRKVMLYAPCGISGEGKTDLFSAKQHFTTAILPVGAMYGSVIRENLEQIHLQTPALDIFIRAKRKGNALKFMTRKDKPSRQNWQSAEETHKNAQKNYILTPENSLSLLQAIEICSPKGDVRADYYDKYRQVNHFVGLVCSTSFVKNLRAGEKVRITDAGCGKGYLSFALAYTLRRDKEVEVELRGIDFNEEVIMSCRNTAGILGFDGADFRAGTILEHIDDGRKTDILVALHACDTATDEALFLGVQEQAELIIAAPCCHKFVNKELRSCNLPTAVSRLAADGIGRERLADLLTDSMRRDLLIELGYTATLIEFTSAEHTLKNVLIRAERRTSTAPPGEKPFKKSYEQWGVAPYFQTLINRTLNNSPSQNAKI